MAAITDYSTLTSAINAWSERSYTSDQTDQFIALAEAEFGLMLRNYRREASATITTDASGNGTLPADFLKLRSLTRDYAGARPLEVIGWQDLVRQNPYGEDGEPIYCAFSDDAFRVAPIAEDDFTLVYEAKLAGLTGSNTTNWLITLAPQAYLSMCLSVQEGFEKNWQEASTWAAKAVQTLNDVGILSDTAQYGNTGIVLDMVCP